MGGKSVIPGDWWAIAGWEGEENFYTIALYYKSAADALVADWVRNRQSVPGREFPWLFCWRHALELLLKSAYRTVLRNQRKPDSEFYQWLSTGGRREHSLRMLWDIVKKAEPEIPVSVIETEIAWLDSVDPDGMSLRYPCAKGGKALLDQFDLYPLEKRTQLQAAWEALLPFREELPRGGIHGPSVRGK
jgi:hypothetical protein